MNIIQKEISLKSKSRGFHLNTDEILSHIDLSNTQVGILMNSNSLNSYKPL